MIRAFAYALALLASLALPAAAQDDDEAGGLLVDFLQDTLSDDNRTVRVTGLEGTFSSRATIEQLTVSDDQGVWLTVRGAVLDWNRLALVRGRFSVNTLGADEIIIERRPGQTTTDPDLPAPEATPFQVPELPVAIELGEIRVDRLVLGEPVLGLAAELELDGSLALADGALDTNLAITRLDRPSDRIGLTARFENATRQITLDLEVVEQSDGLISTALQIPGRPPLSLTAKGEGPVGDFTADIALATDGSERIAGQVRLRALPAADAETAAAAGIAFTADLGGDVTPMLPPRFHDFFGSDTSLHVDGSRDAEGRVEIGEMSVASDALSLDGSLVIASDGRVEIVDVQGGIAPPDGVSVVLPMSGPETTLSRASFAAQLNRAQGDGWAVRLQADGLKRPDLSIGTARIAGVGRIGPEDAIRMQGDITATLTAMELADPALAAATGTDVKLDGHFVWMQDGVLRLDGFEFSGADYRATVDGQLRGLETGLEMQGKVNAGAADLSRFSALSGLDLGGAITAQVSGTAAPLSGSFDLVLNARADGVTTGNDQLDPLIAGETVMALDAARDETGLIIRNFDLDGSQVTANAEGRLSSDTGDLRFQARLADLGLVVPEYGGPLTIAGDVTRNGPDWNGEVDLTGPMESRATLTGTLSQQGAAKFGFDAELKRLEQLVPQLPGTLTATGSAERSTGGDWSGDVVLTGPQASRAALGGSMTPGGKARVDFDAELTRLERLVPQLPGTLTARGTAQRDQDGDWSGEAELAGPQASRATLTGTLTPGGAAELDFDAELRRLERLLPELTGTLTATGDARRDAMGLWTVDAGVQGPAGISTRLAGTWDEASGNADLSAQGQVRLDAANLFIAPNSVIGQANFDLTLRGQPSLDAVSGTIVTSGTSVAIPSVGQTLQNVDASVALGQSRASVNVTGALRAGGTFRVSGPVTLTPPYPATLSVDLNSLVLTDNLSYSTTADGQLSFAGPLAGGGALSGQINFGETDINLIAAAGAAGAAPIPPIAHQGEPGDALRTRQRAGLVETGNGGGGPAIGLNLRLVAQNRVYARGFGLQAEMGGDILVRGTTANVEPSGQIELIRGSLNLLGRRLTLDKGLITLQGDLQPYVEFKSSTSTSEGQATIEISGPLDAPEIEVYSEPERPAEEALALLLFGNRYSELSPLVIAQMAASLARLGSSGSTNKKIKDETGVDNVRVGADEGGAGLFGAGGYLSDNVYTDFTVNSEGETELNLNLDVTDSLTLKGTVDNSGETALGIFFERDY